MSYILDALRKADAQRQRERPGLHAQPVPAGNERSAPAWLRMPAVWIGVIALMAAAMLAVLWPSAQPTPASQAPDPGVVVAPRAVEVVPAPPPVAAVRIDPPPPPMPAPTPPRVAAAPAVKAPAAPTVASASAASPSVSAAPAAKSTAEGPAPADAPKLAITGGVYSQDPAQRMLIVGGQVFNEGSQLAPGVVLEQVRPHQALLSYRGQRYTVGY